MTAMTPRQRQIAAIRHQVPDRIPVDAISVENTQAIADELGIPEGGVLDRLGIDGRIVGPGYRGPAKLGPNREPLGPFGTPETGDYGTGNWYPFGAATGLRDVERHPWPDADDFDAAAASQAATRLAETYAVRGPYWMPLFCQVCNLFGMETAMMKMASEPAVFEAALDAVTTVTTEVCRRFMDACGPDLDIFCLGDDFATQRGLMISPEHWRCFLRPRYARLFEMAKAKGKLVWFHSCGDVTAVLPDLIDIGMDVWETVQLHTLPVPPEDLKRNFGRSIAFFGAVNTQRLPFEPVGWVRDETRRCIDVLGEGGGYICGPDHHVKPDVSVANTLALFDAATSYRRTGYTSAS